MDPTRSCETGPPCRPAGLGSHSRRSAQPRHRPAAAGLPAGRHPELQPAGRRLGNAAGGRAWDPGATPFREVGEAGRADPLTASGETLPVPSAGLLPGSLTRDRLEGLKRPSAVRLHPWIPDTALTDRIMERRTCRPREAEERRTAAAWEECISGDGGRRAVLRAARKSTVHMRRRKDEGKRKRSTKP